MEKRNQQVLLKRRPTGSPTATDFEIAEAPMPDPGEGEVVGQVVHSRDPGFREGDYVYGGYGWQLYSAVPGQGLLKLDPAEAPLSTALGVLGMPGLTAYVGLSEIGRPQRGETVVVSAASGAVGAVAGQLAKRAGARVVGIAGGADKCRYVKEELGFDAALDHH